MLKYISFCKLIFLGLFIIFISINIKKKFREKFREKVRETFNLDYTWGTYYPDNVYHDWLPNIAEYENKIVKLPLGIKKEFVYEKDGCSFGESIIPKLKTVSKYGCEDYLCNDNCNRCNIQQYGNLFEDNNQPLPILNFQI